MPLNLIHGWMKEDELDWLGEVASKCANIIEVGCYKGRSTKALVDNTKGTVHAIDPWDAEVYPENIADAVYQDYCQHGADNIYVEFFNNFRKEILNGKLRVYRTEFLNVRIENPDFIFIDAIHTYEAVKLDIIHALDIMQSGILAGHDYTGNWPGVIEAVEELFPNKKIVNSIWYVQV